MSLSTLGRQAVGKGQGERGGDGLCRSGTQTYDTLFGAVRTNTDDWKEESTYGWSHPSALRIGRYVFKGISRFLLWRGDAILGRFDELEQAKRGATAGKSARERAHNEEDCILTSSYLAACSRSAGVDGGNHGTPAHEHKQWSIQPITRPSPLRRGR